MTERIDLDDIETDTQDEQDADDGEWFWGRGDSDASPEDAASIDGGAATDAGVGSPSSETNADRIPHVPHENKDKPVGIPVESGGAGSGGTGGEQEPEAPQASGPHGGGADDLTFAFTFDAVQRLADVRAALAEANEWADWIGIVGHVDAHEINSFLRETGLDIDFFNGSGDGPGERLADIGPSSMFYADRMAVVGLESTDDESIAAAADWEFVPLEHAAEQADWELAGE
ncbi:hypothetical protein [Salarchaeum sp. JOR-1]|uniref:DUF7124 domain-containing protein n=1 Tax=Salarchaeum sp. JOR-1 TaxID=2599399 RepID=UPI0011989AFD|nr:hypothetical protein [Salarchaeum sp. JOR-1]QDX41403.1 hypothetical protein FQU85_11010 [Salarchaeum sp. JOR-1]